MSNGVELADVELPSRSIALVLTDLGNGSFSVAVVGEIQEVEKPLLEMVLGCKKLMHFDQKTVFDACYEDFADSEGVADDINWANLTGEEPN